MNIKNRITEILAEAKKVKIPEFKSSRDMERFIAKMHPDATPETHIADPETGEIIMDSGQTKRKMAKQKMKRTQSAVNPSVWINSFSRHDYGVWDSLSDFEKLYNIVYRDYSKEVDDPKFLRDNDYDVDFDYPTAIKRKDGKAFDEWDVEAIEAFLTYSNWILPGRNIKIVGKAKKGQNMLRPSVELH